MANEALNINPPNAVLNISTHGSDWLWAAFSIFAFCLLTTVVLDFLVRAHLFSLHRVRFLRLLSSALVALVYSTNLR